MPSNRNVSLTQTSDSTWQIKITHAKEPSILIGLRGVKGKLAWNPGPNADKIEAIAEAVFQLQEGSQKPQGVSFDWADRAIVRMQDGTEEVLNAEISALAQKCHELVLEQLKEIPASLDVQPTKSVQQSSQVVSKPLQIQSINPPVQQPPVSRRSLGEVFEVFQKTSEEVQKRFSDTPFVWRDLVAAQHKERHGSAQWGEKTEIRKEVARGIRDLIESKDTTQARYVFKWLTDMTDEIQREGSLTDQEIRDYLILFLEGRADYNPRAQDANSKHEHLMDRLFDSQDSDKVLQELKMANYLTPEVAAIKNYSSKNVPDSYQMEIRNFDWRDLQAGRFPTVRKYVVDGIQELLRYPVEYFYLPLTQRALIVKEWILAFLKTLQQDTDEKKEEILSNTLFQLKNGDGLKYTQEERDRFIKGLISQSN